MSKKTYDENLKVEFISESHGLSDVVRLVYYRVQPEQLNWLSRAFGNSWKKMYIHKTGSRYIADYFTLDEFRDKVLPLKTIGDVNRFIKEQEMEAQKQLAEMIENRQIWPDENIIYKDSDRTDYDDYD